MSLTEITGFLAAFICAMAMTPQVVKIYRTHKTDDLSLGAFTTLATGLFLWLIYGLLIHSTPVIMGNGVGLGFNLYIIIMKIKNG